jgi:hypothetical protein
MTTPTKRRPTDEELETEVYKLLHGCTHFDVGRHENNEIYCRTCGKTFTQYPFHPRVCTDRNALPELLAALPPRTIVVAAIKALGHWKDEWEEE